MPTQSTTYNSRVTDEALEKRFRDTFRSQGGAELVDDLYAQGVIVPVVDFTSAATGQQLAENLQTAWDFTTERQQVTAANATLVTTSGFWQVDLILSYDGTTGTNSSDVSISDGLTTKPIWEYTSLGISGQQANVVAVESKFVVFLRAGDSLNCSVNADHYLNIWYRQIATVNGDLVDPSGFTSS